MEPPALTHIEKALSDTYRREIDQEENVWRSLPFFTATLALELTALFQIVDRLPSLQTWTGWLSLLLLILSGLFSLIALLLLAASVYPAEFTYIAAEVSLLDYAERLIREEQDPVNQGLDDRFSAVVTLKTSLARQYAEATAHNRKINKTRERSRSIAGLMTICSVLTTLVLVSTSLTYYSQRGPISGDGHGPGQPIPAPADVGRSSGAAGSNGAAPSIASPAPADADRH